MIFSGKRFAVMGLGVNGRAVLSALTAMGADVTAWDDSASRREGIATHDLMDAPMTFDAMVLSPGIPHAHPAPHPVAARALAAGVPILSDAELLFWARPRARFVGVTGTNGKSTTTALIEHILRGAGIPSAAGGNLGTAAIALPELPPGGVYVLEMSSYMLERIDALRFNVAVMLNISPDHLERHGGMTGYIAAKRAVFVGQTLKDTAIIGIDDADSVAMSATLPYPVNVSGHAPADVWVGDGVVIADGVEAGRVPQALPGPHNAQNAAAAVAAARALGVGAADIARGLATFEGLAHRHARVGDRAGVTFIDDSKATNADSAARALALHERVVWIAGGIAKAGGIEPMAPLFSRVAHAVLIGRDAPVFARTLAQAGVAFTFVDGMDEAVSVADARARALDVGTVLLSPACASFDQFADFAARGRAFADAVGRL